MAENKVRIFVLNGQDQIANFSSDTLTRLFIEHPELIGVALRLDILQPGGVRKTIGNYVPQDTNIPVPTPTCSDPNAHFDKVLNKCVCNEGYHLDASINLCKQNPTCGEHAHFDVLQNKCVCDTGYHLENGACVIDAPQPPAPGTLIYDSNTDIDWSKGDQKITTILGDDKVANSKYIRMNASGSPRMYLVAATKEMILEHDGKYGRAYFGVCNYNCRLEVEFKLDKTSSGASFKVRNRHQYAETFDPNAPDSQKQGGQGCGIRTDSVDNDLEVVHGTEMSGPSASLSPKIDVLQYNKVEFSCFDKNGKIHVIVKINGKVVNEGDIAAPSQFFNKTEFDTWSEFWARLNADSGGRMYLKNLRVYTL